MKYKVPTAKATDLTRTIHTDKSCQDNYEF